MTDSGAEAKAAARALARSRRTGLSADERATASALIRAHIIASDVFRSADLVLTYVPVGSEVDVFGVAAVGLGVAKRAAIPRTNGERLSFDQIDTESITSFSPGAFGIPVTSQERPVTSTANTLVLVPLLGYDRRGNRLGSGKGFYDRFLAGFPGVAIGIAFAVQEFDAVPIEPHDRPLDGVITEAGYRSFRSDDQF